MNAAPEIVKARLRLWTENRRVRLKRSFDPNKLDFTLAEHITFRRDIFCLSWRRRRFDTEQYGVFRALSRLARPSDRAHASIGGGVRCEPAALAG